MKRKGIVFLAGALLLSLAGCAGHTRIPDEDRSRLERELPGRTFYLRHAMYLGDFWNDPHKAFLSDGVPGEIPLLADLEGKPIDPGLPRAIVPAGTRVRVVRLELPTSWAVTTRGPLTPRYHPWLLLEVDGLPLRPTPTMVLRPNLGSAAEVRDELDRYLTPDDPAPLLAAMAPTVLRAVQEKRLVEGMDANAVAMAWGYPERKKLSPAPGGRREEWVWPGGKRRAVLVEGKGLVEWTGEEPALEPTAN
jgi:hypothetical protein